MKISPSCHFRLFLGIATQVIILYLESHSIASVSPPPPTPPFSQRRSYPIDHRPSPIVHRIHRLHRTGRKARDIHSSIAMSSNSPSPVAPPSSFSSSSSRPKRHSLIPQSASSSNLRLAYNSNIATPDHPYTYSHSNQYPSSPSPSASQFSSTSPASTGTGTPSGLPARSIRPVSTYANSPAPLPSLGRPATATPGTPSTSSSSPKMTWPNEILSPSKPRYTMAGALGLQAKNSNGAGSSNTSLPHGDKDALEDVGHVHVGEYQWRACSHHCCGPHILQGFSSFLRPVF